MVRGLRAWDIISFSEVGVSGSKHYCYFRVSKLNSYAWWLGGSVPDRKTVRFLNHCMIVINGAIKMSITAGRCSAGYRYTMAKPLIKFWRPWFGGVAYVVDCGSLIWTDDAMSLRIPLTLRPVDLDLDVLQRWRFRVSLVHSLSILVSCKRPSSATTCPFRLRVRTLHHDRCLVPLLMRYIAFDSRQVRYQTFTLPAKVGVMDEWY